MADIEATRQALQSAQRTPIAELQPEITNPNERVAEGEVTITWPFSIVTRSVAFKLVESDFRLRMNNGQVRVDFYGAAGKAVTKAALGGGDEVQLSLEGVEWVQAPPPKRPDTLEWQLEFTNRLRLKVKRADDGEEVILDVDGPDGEEAEDSLHTMTNTLEPSAPLADAPTPAVLASASASVEPTPSPLLATPALPNKRLASSAFEEDEYASPAFLKRTRLSHGGFWEGDLEDFDDERKQKKKKRRSRFSMVEKWTYSSRTPSPEPEAQPELEQLEEPESEDEEHEEQVPSIIKPSPPMVDEGVQTRIEDKIPVGTPQPPAEALTQSPGPPSSPTPAGVPEPPVMQVEEEQPPVSSTQEEPRQAPPLSNPFASFQPSLGQPQQTSPARASGFGSGTVSGFGSMSGFASQAPFGSAPAFGVSSGIEPPSSSVAAFGAPSGVGFGAGLGTGLGTSTDSVFGANSRSGFGSGFSISNGDLQPSASTYPEPTTTTAEEQPVEDILSGDEAGRLYKANEFYSAPADHRTVSQPHLQDELQNDAGDFTHDIAANVPAFAPSQLEQASWGTLTSLPPQSQAPEPNNLENPVEILSSSPPRAPSPGEEHDTREFDDLQPETSDVEAEEGEHMREEGYMQVEPVPEDAPIEGDETPAQTQVEETDDNEDGGDVAGEDYDLRNYDDAQEDDVVESDYSSEQLVDKSDPDQQAVDFEDEDESEIDEEEELEYTVPGRMGHGLADEPGEFDAEGEIDDEHDYEEEYSEEEALDYDEEEENEPPPFTGAPAPPPSKEPVFIDLLSDSDDDAPAPAPAAPLPTAAVRERESPKPEVSNNQEARPPAPAEALEHALEAEFDPHSEASHDVDEDAEAVDPQHYQAAGSPVLGEEQDYDSSADTPPSQGSSPPPNEDEDLGPANAPFAAPIAAESQTQERPKDADVLEKEVESTKMDPREAQPPPGVEVEDVEMQDRHDGEELTAGVETQGTSDANYSQPVSFESQPRNIFDFAATASQDISQPEATLDFTQDVVPAPEIEESSLKAASDAKSTPRVVESKVEVTEVIEEAGKQETPTGEEDDEAHPTVIVEEAASVVVNAESSLDKSKIGPDEATAGTSAEIADGQRHHDSEAMRDDGGPQSIDQPSATSVPESQTIPSETQQPAEALQQAEHDPSVAGKESLPPLGESQQTQNAMQLDEEAEDNDSEREYSLALEQQIMSELGDSQRSQAEIPSIEEHDTVEQPTRRVTRAKAKQKPERDILITEKSLRSWPRKSMSSVATDEDPSFVLARASSDAADEPKKSQEKHATPDPSQRSQSQASPQSIRVTRSKNHDDDPSLMLAEETPQRKGRKGTPAKTRETRSTVAASAEPEEQPKSQTSTQTLRATRNTGQDEDPSLMLAKAKESQEEQSSAPTVHATRSKDDEEDPSLFLSEATPRPRKIRGEVTPEPELGSERSLRSKTPEPAAGQSKSPSAAKSAAAKENTSLVEEDETIASLKLKLSKELRASLPDCIPLSTLRNHMGEKTDIMGVVAVTPGAPIRPKSGPRDYMMELLITDPASAASSSSVSVAHLFRPHQTSLPSVTVGDIILLRHFNIQAMKGRGYGLRSVDSSSWAVWEKADTEGFPQIKGPPVELGEAQSRYVQGLRKWWDLAERDEKLRDKLERKTQQVIKIGRENRGKADKEAD